MRTKAIFAEFSVPWWVTVAQNLVRRHDWEPVYWVAHEVMAKDVAAAFPSAVFHANNEAVRCIPPAQTAALPLKPLDQPLLESLARAEAICLRMMERMDADETFAYWDRVRLFHRHLRYWQAVLDHFQPDVLVQPASPHMIYDYVLAELCRLRGVRTLQLNETSFEGLLYSSPSYENSSDAVVRVYQRLLEDGDKVEPSPRVRAHFGRLRGDYTEAAPCYVKDLFDLKDLGVTPHAAPQPPKGPGFFARQWAKVQRIRRAVWHRARVVQRPGFWHNVYSRLLDRAATDTPLVEHPLVGDAVDAAFAIYAKMQEYMGRVYPVTNRVDSLYLREYAVSPERSDFSGLMYWLFRLMGMKKRETLRDHYSRLARPVDLDQPYVYVALHYGPEKSTSPEGEYFVDQFLLIHLISYFVPDGWSVYVKEHPFQLDARGSGFMSRRTQFYDDVAELPNVRLVDLKSPAFELIDRARAVATVTGTTGWEAVVRGKPVLIFGNAWYRGCEGVFYTPSLDSCADAIRQIAAGYWPDEARVRLFAAAMEQVALPGFTIPDVQAASGLTAEQNVEVMTRLLADARPRAAPPESAPFR